MYPSLFHAPFPFPLLLVLSSLNMLNFRTFIIKEKSHPKKGSKEKKEFLNASFIPITTFSLEVKEKRKQKDEKDDDEDERKHLFLCLTIVRYIVVCMK